MIYPKCKHCKRKRENHKAFTFNCPIGRGYFPHFHADVFYEPSKPRKPIEQGFQI